MSCVSAVRSEVPQPQTFPGELTGRTAKPGWGESRTPFRVILQSWFLNLTSTLDLYRVTNDSLKVATITQYSKEQYFKFKNSMVNAAVMLCCASALSIQMGL